MSKSTARRLPSGLIEGSAAAIAAEKAESDAFDRAHGLTPRTKPVAEPSGPTTAQRAIRRLGIDLGGTR